MLDFTSSLYLGFRHPSHSLGPWQDLTTGAPAALCEPDLTHQVAHALARLQGCERGVLAPSTLHLFWDLFGILSREPVIIYLDKGAYPISRWGVERAAGKGAHVLEFLHQDPSALRRLLKRNHRRGVRPLIVTDGFCPACGRPAPVREYQACAVEFNGILIIDDTQSLGILGHSPGRNAPYGIGGGGLLRWFDAYGPEIIVITSLAKGFGVPMALLSGSSAMITQFEQKSETRVHCSQPSAASIRAALHALAANTQSGDALRLRLARLVTRFRNRLAFLGLSATGGLFPFQTITPFPGMNAIAIHEQLLRRNIRAVLHKGGSGNVPRLSFIITARHTPNDIDTAVNCLNDVTGNPAQHDHGLCRKKVSGDPFQFWT